jgi:hypothetical protein
MIVEICKMQDLSFIRLFLHKLIQYLIRIMLFLLSIKSVYKTELKILETLKKNI